MGKLLLGICLLLSVITDATAQDDLLLQRFGYFSYTIPFEGDSLTYYMGGGTRDRDPEKLVLFLQGSMPKPLLVVENDGSVVANIPISPMDYAAEYYFCVVPKPGIPPVAKREELDELGMYLDQGTGEMIAAYQERNYLDYYVRSREAVLQDITRKIRLEQVVVVGGSEGARLGAKLALVSDLVTHLVYFSSDPFGRYLEKILDVKFRLLKGETSEEAAREKIEAVMEEWKTMNQEPESTSEKGGDTNRAWVSFSEPAFYDLLALGIPVLVAYGTADKKVFNMELLQLEAIRQRKSNLHFRAYFNHDHYLRKCKFDENAQLTDVEFVFDTIYAEWLAWVNSH